MGKLTIPFRKNPIETHAVSMDCNNPRNLSSCNYINNNTFSLSPSYISSSDYSDPFNIPDPQNSQMSLVPDWKASHGTPQAYDGIDAWSNSLPFPGAGYARFGSFENYFPVGTGGEGIIQKIPSLQPGHKYLLSFFRKIDAFCVPYISDWLKVVMAHCAESSNFNPSNYPTPILQSNSQVVYCDHNFTSQNWERIVVYFTANENYDMIMVYPEQDVINYNSEGVTLFSYPELIDITNFSAGLPPQPTPANCNVTIGPLSPNCGVYGATYTWHGPSGQTILAAPNQQLQLNTGDQQNVGVWTLSMDIPNVYTPNNSCSDNNPSVAATVNVRYLAVNFEQVKNRDICLTN